MSQYVGLFLFGGLHGHGSCRSNGTLMDHLWDTKNGLDTRHLLVPGDVFQAVAVATETEQYATFPAQNYSIKTQ